MLFSETRVTFNVAEGGGVSLSGAAVSGGARQSLFDPQWKFEDLGIGGLDEQFRASHPEEEEER